MSSDRASVFDQGPDIDVSDFTPRKIARHVIEANQVKAVSETANFVSREPAVTIPASANREPRRHRTGRNIQLNIKARAETIERFYAVADRNGWVLGETFERAVEALEGTAAN